MSETEISPKTECIRKPNFTECLMVRSSEVWIPKCGLNTRHDNREVALTHFTQAQTLCSDK